MTIEEAIYAHLTGNAAVTAFIGDRLFPDHMPQDTPTPSIAFSRISTGRDMVMSGHCGLTDARFQFNCYSPLHAQARALADAVRLALIGYQGSMGGVSGVTVCGVFPESEFDGYDDNLQLYVVISDYTVQHIEPKPG